MVKEHQQQEKGLEFDRKNKNAINMSEIIEMSK